MNPDPLGPDQASRSVGGPVPPPPGIDPATLFPSGLGAAGHGKPVLLPVPRAAPAPVQPPKGAAPAPLDERQTEAAASLRRALDEGHVYAALTGPPGSGKTAVLDAVMSPARNLRILRIRDPHTVSDKLGAQIEQVALAEAAKPETDRHVVITVDDAHAASVDLLDSLSRLASAGRSAGRLPQVLLVGHPVLWDRLKAERFRPLERRIVSRHEMRAASADDPWAPLERALASAHEGAPSVAAPRGPPASSVVPPPAPPAAAPAPAAPVPPPAPSPRPASAPALDPGPREASFDDIIMRRGDLLGSRPSRSRRWPWVMVTVAMVMVAGLAAVRLGLVKSLVPAEGPAPAPRTVAEAPPPPAASNTPPVPPSSQPAPGPSLGPAPAGPPPAAPDTSLAAPGPPPVPEPPAGPAVPEPPASPAAAPRPAPPPAPAFVPAPEPAPEPVPAPPSAAPPVSASPPPLAAEAPRLPAAPAVAAVPPDVAALLIRRGETLLALGDIAAARSYFERAAGGNGRAAFLAARTYDPAVLTPEAAGMADAKRAGDWYGHAAALGDADAAAWLRRNGGGSR